MLGLHRSAVKALAVALVLSGASINASGDTVYFLVGGHPWGVVPPGSYVLPLSRPQDIDYARYLIAAGPSGGSNDTINFIVVANCVSGKDGVNRDYLDPTFREWSWHVSEFLEFAQVTAEVLDGSPAGTEYMFTNAPPDVKFEIGYWTYTVVRELGPAPLFLSILPDGDNLQLYWSAPSTNYSYTLEGNQSPGGTNWFAIPGASWPLMTNHWTLPRTNTPAHFFRVRAVGPAPMPADRFTRAARIPATNSS